MRRRRQSPRSPRSHQPAPPPPPLKRNTRLVVKQFQRDFLTGVIPPPSKDVLVSSTLPPIPVLHLSTRAASPSTAIVDRGGVDRLRSSTHGSGSSKSSVSSTLLSSAQRSQYPQSARAPDAFLGWQDKASARWLASRLRVHDLVDGFEARRTTTLASFRAHCSPNVQDPEYDAIDGAENALLYIRHTITDEDFHPLAKVAEFDSKFIEIMSVFLAKGFHDVLRPGSESLDGEALAQLTRKVAEDASLRKDPSSPLTPRRQQQQQPSATPPPQNTNGNRISEKVDKKKLYKSFRVAHRGAEPDDDSMFSAWSKPKQDVVSKHGARRDKELVSNSDDDDDD